MTGARVNHTNRQGQRDLFLKQITPTPLIYCIQNLRGGSELMGLT